MADNSQIMSLQDSDEIHLQKMIFGSRNGREEQAQLFTLGRLH